MWVLAGYKKEGTGYNDFVKKHKGIPVPDSSASFWRGKELIIS